MGSSREEAIRPEPKYGRRVFERLLEVSGIGVEFFDVRDDGAWLVEEASVDALNWTPACDLEGPTSPDPLSTPAIPFPFSGPQLAAWMLDGWGVYLGEAVGVFDPEAKSNDLRAKLGTAVLDGLGVQAVKVREALEDAYRAFDSVVARVGLPDFSLQTRESQTGVALIEARRAAASAHNWREQGITAEELESRRLAYLSDIKEHRAAHAAARSANTEAFRSWRRRMVRALIGKELAEPKPSKSRSVRKLTAEQDQEIAAKHAARRTIKSLAQEYGVSRRTVDESLARSGRRISSKSG